MSITFSTTCRTFVYLITWKKKNFKQIVKMNERFSKKQKYNINCRKSHDNGAQNQREHIAKFIAFLNVVSVL